MNCRGSHQFFFSRKKTNDISQKRLYTMKEKLAMLLIKTGLFFANCDGEYDPRERKFISNFITSLEINHVLDPDCYDKQALEDAVPGSIDDLITETNSFIQQLEAAERQPFVEMMDKYIEGVVKADNVIDPNEALFYGKWKENIKY